MNPKTKKILLQVELAHLELVEAEQLFTQYNEEFIKEFGEELRFLESQKSPLKDAQKQHKKILPPINEVAPSASDLVQNLYRNLAKKIHPDVSSHLNAVVLFKRLTNLYEKGDVVGILSLAVEAQIELPPFQENDYKLIEKKIKHRYKKVTDISQRLAWVWKKNKNDPKIKEIIYTTLELDLEEFTNWKETDQ